MSELKLTACPNCNCETDSHVCPDCGMNITLMLKSQRISNSYYNKGLSQAKTGDLSNSLSSLSKSIEFDKSNIDARNLLSLVYFELGMIGDAIMQCVISSNFNPKENLALDYLNIFQKNTRQLEKFNDSIIMYNQSLEYLRQRNDDVAIIQLKKALEVNPNFIDARNLLALCYLKHKDISRATVEIEKVLARDISNATALRYAREINLSFVRQEQKFRNYVKQEQRQIRPNYGVSLEKQKGSFSFLYFLLVFIVGIAATCAVFYFVVMPPQLSKHDLQMDKLRTEHQQSYQLLLNDKNGIELKFNDLFKLNESNKQVLAHQSGTIDLLEKMRKMDSVNNLFIQGQHLEAVTELETVSVEGLSLEYKELYQNIKGISYPLLEKQFYNGGFTHYNARRYEDAKLSFLRSIEFGTSDSKLDNAYYYLARVYEIEKSYTESRKYYELILENYAASFHFNNATARLRNLPQ